MVSEMTTAQKPEAIKSWISKNGELAIGGSKYLPNMKELGYIESVTLSVESLEQIVREARIDARVTVNKSPHVGISDSGYINALKVRLGIV